MKVFMVEDHMVLVNYGSLSDNNLVWWLKLLLARCSVGDIEDLWGFDILEIQGARCHDESKINGLGYLFVSIMNSFWMCLKTMFGFHGVVSCPLWTWLVFTLGGCALPYYGFEIYEYLDGGNLLRP